VLARDFRGKTCKVDAPDTSHADSEKRPDGKELLESLGASSSEREDRDEKEVDDERPLATESVRGESEDDGSLCLRVSIESRRDAWRRTTGRKSKVRVIEVVIADVVCPNATVNRDTVKETAKKSIASHIQLAHPEKKNAAWRGVRDPARAKGDFPTPEADCTNDKTSAPSSDALPLPLSPGPCVKEPGCLHRHSSFLARTYLLGKAGEILNCETSDVSAAA
jgi:hypothetical protein